MENSENKASGEYRTIMLAMLPYQPLSKPHPYHPISQTNREWLLPMQTSSLIICLLTIIRTIMTIRLMLIPVSMRIRDGLSIDHVQWTNGFSPNAQSMQRLARGVRASRLPLANHSDTGEASSGCQHSQCLPSLRFFLQASVGCNLCLKVENFFQTLANPNPSQQSFHLLS